MPERDDLTQLFPAPADNRIGTDAVVRRARRRRIPRQIAVGGVAAVAVVGIVIGGGSLLRTTSMATSAGSAGSADSAAQPEVAPGGAGGGADASTGDRSDGGGAAGGDSTTSGGISLAPAEKLNPCAGPLAEIAPAQSGLVLTTDFPSEIEAGAASVDGTVTLTNTGTERLTGTTAATPAITLSQDGTTVWHSNGAMIMMAAEVDLAPGESMTYPATLTPVVCGDEDEGLESFRDDLPAAAPGDYDVSAAIQFTPADPEGSGLPIETVTGPLQPVTIR